MNANAWGGLDEVSIDEVRRRALVMQRLSDCEPVVVPGAEVVGWQSFAGDHVNWLFFPDGRALLLPYDHESELNLEPEWEVDVQRDMYAGVPGDLLAVVLGREDGAEFAMIESVPAASGVFWFDGARWRASPGLERLAAERDLDIARDTGLRFCLSWYRFGGEFTADSLIADGAEERWGYAPDEVRALFAGVYGA